MNLILKNFLTDEVTWITMTFHGILCWHTITALVW